MQNFQRFSLNVIVLGQEERQVKKFYGRKKSLHDDSAHHFHALHVLRILPTLDVDFCTHGSFYNTTNTQTKITTWVQLPEITSSVHKETNGCKSTLGSPSYFSSLSTRTFPTDSNTSTNSLSISKWKVGVKIFLRFFQ